MLLGAGQGVVGIDQSTGMLRRAREHFPEAQYEKMGMQEMSFREALDGVICMDAMEHVSPEDYPGILRKFQKALKPGCCILRWTGQIRATWRKPTGRHRRKACPWCSEKWIDQAGMTIEKEGPGGRYHHFVARKKNE